MNQQTKNRDKNIQRTSAGLGMLFLGMCLLVLGGMNLFTNVLQIRDGQWQQNILLSVLLTLAFSALPAIIGGWLVYRATATISPPPSSSGQSK